MIGADHFVRLQRRFRVPALGAERNLTELRRPGLRLYVIETRGVRVESRVAPSLRPVRSTRDPAVAQVTIPLVGAFVVRRDGAERVFTGGRAAVERVDAWDERWDGAHFRALVVEWDARHGDALGALDDAPLSTGDTAWFDEVARRVDAAAVDDALIARTVGVLRACGLPLHPGRAMPIGKPPPGTAVIARSLGALLSNLERAPDIADLCVATGMQERQLRRKLVAARHWTRCVRSWKALLSSTRLTMAATLSTARGATVEITARALGYGAPSALLAAMRDGGLPPPSRIRALGA